jgi:hypothetical protein
VDPLLSNRPPTKRKRYRISISRNVRHFYDAVWLYETFLLIHDRPSALSVLISNGNYESMLSMHVSVCTVINDASM